MATVRLPAGGTRAIPLAATKPPEATLLGTPEIPVPDFRELWKRREWIRALAGRLNDRTGEEDSERQEGSDKGAATKKEP